MVSIDNKSRVRELFAYSDGVLYWKAKSSKYSRAKIGGEAGSKDKDGYIIIRVRNETRGAHRLVWIYHNGKIPNGMEVDHMDGDITNNRIENLRLVTRTINNRNQKKRSDNTTGVSGVTFMKDRGKYRAQVRNKRLGQFDTIEEAAQAVNYERDRLGLFTKRHGV